MMDQTGKKTEDTEKDIKWVAFFLWDGTKGIGFINHTHGYDYAYLMSDKGDDRRVPIEAIMKMVPLEVNIDWDKEPTIY